MIFAVHAKPETALANTFHRFETLGRGAGVNVMATIQGGLPAGLEAVREHFGSAVEIKFIDNRDSANRSVLVGWHNLELLRSEGNYEQIKHRLTTALEQHRAAGTITEACYRQASGAAPLGPGVSGGRGEAPFLSAEIDARQHFDPRASGREARQTHTCTCVPCVLASGTNGRRGG